MTVWFEVYVFLSSPGGNDGFDVKHFLFRYCNMQGKHENDDHQLWRLKVDNSLRLYHTFYLSFFYTDKIFGE